MGALEAFRQAIMGNQYVYAIVILLLFLILAKALLSVLQYLVKKSLKSEKHQLEKKIIVKIENPLVIILVLIGIQLAIGQVLESRLYFINLVNTGIIILITYIVMVVADVFLQLWSHNMAKKKGPSFHEEVLPLTQSVSKLLFGAIGLIFILLEWEVEIAPLLGGIGIISVVLGFALKDSLTNIFGGISLIMDDSFRKHDIIELETGELGEVREINLRSTQIKTFDDEMLRVPNGVLANMRFKNFAQPNNIVRLKIDVSVEYGSDPDQVEQVLLGVLKGRKDIVPFRKREVRFIKMSDFSLDFQLLFFIEDYHTRFQVQNEVTRDVYKALYENNIGIPFPARTIFKGTEKSYNPSQKRKSR